MLNQNLLLQDIKVIEFTHMVMGPTVGMILADLGAEVIKIEPLGGDKTRRLKGSGAGYFPMYNRNKKSICIDMKSEQGTALAKQLVDQADVVIENFRPGAMEKLGFGYEELKKTNPGLVYSSQKGFLSGPYEHRTALDEVAQMMGGLAHMTGLPGKPMRAGSSVIDITGGMFGVIGILAALHRRNTTGLGEHVTSSLFETTAFMVGQHMAQQAVSGQEPQPMTVRTAAWSIYDIFHNADDERVFVGVVSDILWKRFCEEFELIEFSNDRSLDANNDRVAQRDRIMPVVQELFLGMSNEEMLQRLDRAGVPFAPINRPTNLFDDPHLNANGGLLDVTLADGDHRGERTHLPALPIETGQGKFSLRQDVPTAGQHTREVFKGLGYSQDEIQQMFQAGVLA